MSTRGLVIGSALLSLVVVACAKDDSQTTTRTEREKDSLIARSPVPGAKAVGKAMSVADSAAARGARIDTAQQNP